LSDRLARRNLAVSVGAGRGQRRTSQGERDGVNEIGRTDGLENDVGETVPDQRRPASRVKVSGQREDRYRQTALPHLAE
jgi:hypothetical protein